MRWLRVNDIMCPPPPMQVSSLGYGAVLVRGCVAAVEVLLCCCIECIFGADVLMCLR